MPKYLIQANYVGKGVSGLLKEGGTKRRTAIEESFKGMGGSLESFYFAFGETDVFVIGDLPDNACAAALALAVNAAGAATCKTTVLITPQEVDEAAKKSVTYRAPGS
jgi:uncharacterized protein with GYD domain